MKEIDVFDLKNLLEENNVTLIDVREEYETKICSIEGSLFMPMSTISGLLGALDKNKKYAIICHSGIRSLNVTNFLNNNGYMATNVKGGIDEWSVCVDKKMKRY